MIKPVSEHTGTDLTFGSTDSYRPRVYSQGFEKDRFESHGEHHQENEHGPEKGVESIVTKPIGKVKEIVGNALALPKVLWTRFWHGEEALEHGNDGGGHANAFLPEDGLPNAPADNPFLAEKGFLSADTDDERGAMFAREQLI